MLIIALCTAFAGPVEAVPYEPRPPQEEPLPDPSNLPPCGIPIPDECTSHPTERCGFICPGDPEWVLEPDPRVSEVLMPDFPDGPPCGIPVMDDCLPHPTERCGQICPGEMLFDYGVMPAPTQGVDKQETTEIYRDSRDGLPACALPMRRGCQIDPHYRCGFVCEGQPRWNAPIQDVAFYAWGGPTKACTGRRAGKVRMGTDGVTQFHCDGRVWHAVSVRQVQ